MPGSEREGKNKNGFTFKPEDLKIDTYGSRTNALAIITHIPTGVTVEGHDPLFPGSTIAARVVAMKLLSQKVEGHEHETFWDWSQEAHRWARWLVGTPYAIDPEDASYNSPRRTAGADET